MSNAIRFIGNYDVTAEGKFLWELLAQMRNFGVGRIVTKNEWLRKWPQQPSYIKIVKARPAMDRWLQRGKLWGEWTFRGRHLGLYEFGADLNRSDWRLIYKHEEKEFTNCEKPMSYIEVPSSFPLPPLQIYLTKQAAKKRNKHVKIDERAPLDFCLDPEFVFLKPFIKKVEPKNHSASIYDEVDPETFLDFYGEEMPPRVDTWNIGPAIVRHRFVPSPFGSEAETSGAIV